MSFLIPAGLVAGGAGAGALANRKAARTSTSQQTNDTSSSGSQSSSTRRFLTDEQNDILARLAGRSAEMMTNPGARVEPLAVAARGRINSAYSGAPQAIADKYLTSGGASGKYGRAARGVEMSRLGALASNESDVIRMILEQQDQGSSLAERLLGMSFGTETSSNFSQTGTGQMSGEQVAAGSPLAAGVGGGLQALTALLGLNAMLKGGGGSSGSGRGLW